MASHNVSSLSSWGWKRCDRNLTRWWQNKSCYNYFCVNTLRTHGSFAFSLSELFGLHQCLALKSFTTQWLEMILFLLAQQSPAFICRSLPGESQMRYANHLSPRYEVYTCIFCVPLLNHCLHCYGGCSRHRYHYIRFAIKSGRIPLLLPTVRPFVFFLGIRLALTPRRFRIVLIGNVTGIPVS